MPEGKRPLGVFTGRRNDNIKLDLKTIMWKPEGWIYVVQERQKWRAVVKAVMNILVP
jgi:hypothetical protein